MSKRRATAKCVRSLVVAAAFSVLVFSVYVVFVVVNVLLITLHSVRVIGV